VKKLLSGPDPGAVNKKSNIYFIIEINQDFKLRDYLKAQKI
jgi:hypothetical protein